MRELLFLAHRFPYPPDKGDKIRSWHFLRHLAQRFDVHLGCFIDDARDWALVADVQAICKSCCILPLSPSSAKVRSLWGLLDGRALTLPYYFDRKLSGWTSAVLARPDLSAIFIYCSAMAQYVPVADRRSRRSIADLVDVDSAKWGDYARKMRMPEAWIYRREARLLQRVERQIAETFQATMVATAAERNSLRDIAPGAVDRMIHLGNGVDSDYFSPGRHYPSPFAPGIIPVVFVGAMDYWPNVDAVTHFANAVFPALRRRHPAAQFTIVGSNPTAAVKALAELDGVVVTGRVADVRPYLAHAHAVVAPLRIARGVQNKVLEAMAMAKIVVASPQALTGITGIAGSDYLMADSDDAFAAGVDRLIRGEVDRDMGRRARERVVSDYSWASSLARLDRLIDD